MQGFAKALSLVTAFALTSCSGDSVIYLFDGYVPSLERNITVTDLLFFESSYEHIVSGNEDYSTTFDGSDTRFINWEVRMEHPPMDQDQEFRIQSSYLNKNGTPVGMTRHTGMIESHWDYSYHGTGYGDEHRRFWRYYSGRFTVEIFIDDTHIGTGSFRVR